MQLIGISGKAGAGKTTLATMIREVLLTRGCHDVRISPMATPIYNIAADILHTTVEWLKANKTTELPALQMTVRHILQRIGDGMREAVHPQIWVVAKQHQILRLKDEGCEVVIVDDVRYPNEVEMMRNLNGYRIRIEGRASNPDDTHPSEVSLDNWTDFDLIVDNRGTLAALKSHAMSIVTHIINGI